MTASAPAPAARMPLLDAVKGVACLFIVAHHLTRYGPLAEGAYRLTPGPVAWFYNHGQLAVQVFVVIGGFLAAASLAPGDRPLPQRPGARIAQRYARLAMPYLAALTFSVLVAAAVRPWLHDDAVPAAPTLLQLLSHGLLLQDLLGQPALSAGVWYVAIDSQLFTLALLLFSAVGWLQQRRRWSDDHARRAAVAGALLLAGASLAVFNRHEAWDDTGLYFFGAYGLGMAAFWAGRLRSRRAWAACLALLLLAGAAALQIEWRIRIAVALATALALVLARRARWPRPAGAAPLARPLLWLGRISYSLFLIHFPVILLVNALVDRLWPASPWVDELGLLAAAALAIGAGALLHRFVESRPPSWPRLLALFAALVLCGVLASAGQGAGVMG